MTRPITRTDVTQTINAMATLQLLEIEPGLFAFERTIDSKAVRAAARDMAKAAAKSDMTFPTVALPKSTWFGLVDTKGRDALMKGRTPKLLDLQVVSTAHIELFRTRGYVAGEAAVWANERAQNPFALFSTDDSLTADNLVRMEHSGHMLFDRHGAVLPCAQLCDYIGSPLNESRYDLEAVAAHLLKRSDIVVWSGSDKRTRERGVAANVKDAVFTIPYYNTEPGRAYCVQFTWIPTHADFARVWAECKGQYPSTQIRAQFFDLDIADIKQFALPQADDDA